MTDIKDQFQEARLKAIRELEKNGKNAYLPANAWGLDLSAIDRAKLSPDTKKGYRRELVAFLKAGISSTDFEALQEYASSLTPKRRLFLRLAIRLVTLEYEQSTKANATPENYPVLQAILMRLEAMRESVTAKSNFDPNSHIWLSWSQVEEITKLCGDDLEGKRDWIILHHFLSSSPYPYFSAFDLKSSII